jgi:hypothetical protein
MRRRVAIVLFVLIAVASIDPNLLRRAVNVPEDHTRTVPYEIFLTGVRERTQPGDSVALLLPTARWNEAYHHAFSRATYVLAGRKLLPAVWGESIVPEHIERASHIAAWEVQPLDLERPVIWVAGAGQLFGPK